jgi:hypothetical protein
MPEPTVDFITSLHAYGAAEARDTGGADASK